MSGFNRGDSTIQVTPSASASTVTTGVFTGKGKDADAVFVVNATNVAVFVTFRLGTASVTSAGDMIKGYVVLPSTSVAVGKNVSADTIDIMTENATPTGKVHFTPGFILEGH